MSREGTEEGEEGKAWETGDKGGSAQLSGQCNCEQYLFASKKSFAENYKGKFSRVFDLQQIFTAVLI